MRTWSIADILSRFGQERAFPAAEWTAPKHYQAGHMRLTVSLDRSGRWHWQFQDGEGLIVVRGESTFATYELAALNAEMTLLQAADAPIEIEGREGSTGKRHFEPQLAEEETEGEFDDFCAVMSSSGLHEALKVLNRGVTHRYTALYRLSGNVLRNAVLVDKLESIVPSTLASVPYDQSFCQFAIRDGHFSTDNSAWDARLSGHPAQGIVNAYHAFPLASDSGKVLGSICHFDMAPLPLSATKYKLLGRVARVLVEYLVRQDATAAAEHSRPDTGLATEHGETRGA